MTISSKLLFGALALNVFLLAAVIYPRASRNYFAPGNVSAAVSDADHPTANHSPTPSSPEVTAGGSPKPGPGRPLWSQLQTDDLAQLATQLRAAGFPAKTVRSILTALFEKRYSARREALLGKAEDTPYWKQPRYTSNDPKIKSQLDALDLEQGKFYRQLFRNPSDLMEDEEALANARRQFGNFSAEKLQRINQLQTDSQLAVEEILSGLRTRPSQEFTSEERKKLAATEQKFRDDVAAFLPPDELEQFELRNSPRASQLRNSLDTFRPTEAEFKALVALYRPVDQSGWNFDETQMRAQRAAEEQLKPQIAALLGPDRYADFVQAQQNGSDKFNRLVARLDLPLATVGQVNAVRDDLTARAKAVRSDQTLAPAERDAQLNALATEANAKVMSKLGARGYEAYQEMKGDWIRALQPK